LADGRRVFLAVAGQRFAKDPHLDELVVAQDGVPLAIELLAYLADAETNLAGLWRRWQAKRVALLRRGSANSPQLSAEVSFQLSITGPRMTTNARRLLSLLALLPDGVAHQDLDLLLPEEGEDAAATLRRVGLAFDEGPRLRMLQPIRDHTRKHHPPEPDDFRRTEAHYRQLAVTLSPRVGSSSGAAALAQLTAEAGNLETILLHNLTSDDLNLDDDDPTGPFEAAIALTPFLQLSGFGSTRILEAALNHAQQFGAVLYQARCLLSLGTIALRRSDNAAAAGYFEQARALFEQVENVQGQANCLLSLGVIALEQFDYVAAGGYLEQAQPLFEQAEDIRGQAHCIRRLGWVALRRSDHAAAAGYFEQAQRLYEHVGDVLGQANCLLSLGDMALERSDHAAAGYFEQAQRLYEQAGDALGMANCLQALGDMALERSDHAAAAGYYEQALDLYGGIPEPYSIGQTHRRLAHLAASSGERGRHVQAARDAWNTIARVDLIHSLDREFGDV
jgi:tetratricopeptide (TPR) repeat protein